jgi:hypothetical protein
MGVRIAPEKGSKLEGLLIYKERFGGGLVKGYTCGNTPSVRSSTVCTILLRESELAETS